MPSARLTKISRSALTVGDFSAGLLPGLRRYCRAQSGKSGSDRPWFFLRDKPESPEFFAEGAESVKPIFRVHSSPETLNILAVAGALSSALIKSAYRLLLLVVVGVQGQSINRG